MNDRDRQFLKRADAVTANYQAKIEALKQVYEDNSAGCIAEETLRGFFAFADVAYELDALQTEAEQHQQRVNQLRSEARRTAALNTLCADASKQAGSDGLNFWKKAGRALTPKETPDAKTKAKRDTRRSDCSD